MGDSVSIPALLPTDARRETLRQAIGEELFHALRGRQTVAPLSGRGLQLNIDDAYAISLASLSLRCADGERVVGKKIGVTSKAVQDMLGVYQPDFGFLTDQMEVANGAPIDVNARRLIQPRAEAEIAFILGSDLIGPGITESDVLEATDWIAPCFEIVDSRIDDWQIGIVDTIADNASCGVYVLGESRVSPNGLDLSALKVTVWKNGEFLSEGFGSAVQGSPLTAVAWLANTLGQYGVSLNAGDVILSGSLVPLAPAVAGDRFEMELQGVGRALTCFI
ncbi:fumarylacetoacetate hydrolase family protein [Pseudomonas sp. H11T01]|uniref:fumarylacetoacetate hydrolase family protein n=1 Tax=Pseudomonas sp. H11T01 TaxID=3402749 RepID=UPI003AD56D76